MRKYRFLCTVMAIWLPLLAASSAPARAAQVGGVEVVAVKSLIMATAPTLAVGDIIVAYVPQPASAAGTRTPIAGALQWRLFEAGELPAGPVRLELLRGGRTIELALADGWMDLRVASTATASPLEAADDRLLAAQALRDWPAAEAAYADARKALGEVLVPDAGALIALHGAQLAMAQYQWQIARDRLAPALEIQPESLLRVALLEHDATCQGQMRRWQDAQQTRLEAAQIAARLAPAQLMHVRVAMLLAQVDSFADPKHALVSAQAVLANARAACAGCAALSPVLLGYGDVLWNLHRVADAGKAYAEALELARALRPGEMALFRPLMRNATVLRRSGYPERAETLLHEAQALLQTLAGPDIDRATVYNDLGAVANQLGKLSAARSWYQQSLAISQGLDRRGIDNAAPLHNLAQVLINDGSYEQADRLLLEAIEILERAGNGPNLPLFLTTRAQLEVQRGNDELAQSILERVRDLQLAVNADAEILGIAYQELAKLHLRSGRVDAARAAQRLALAVFEKQPVESFALAGPLTEAGYIELALGDLDQATDYFSRVSALFRERGPDSLRASAALQGAGEVALQRAELARARDLIDQALKIRLREAPDTAAVAQSLHTLGRIAAADQRDDAARTAYCRAAEVLDRASLRSGGGDLGETRFRARFAEVYHDCLAATVGAGDAQAALLVLERSRARGFRHALEQRRVQLRAPGQQQAVSQLADNGLAYERALDGANDPRLEPQVRRLARERAQALLDQRERLQQQAATALPRWASLFAAAPETLASLRARLPADTSYIAWSVGERSTVVLAVHGTAPVHARIIPIGGSEISQRVRELRRLLAEPGAAPQQEFVERSGQLAHDLLAPVTADLAPGTRLLLSPDGALHSLPFAALWQTDTKQWLIEAHTLTFIDALGSLAKVPAVSSAVDTAAGKLLAVGDPVISAASLPEIGRRLRSAPADERTLPPLPSARREVQALAARYPGHTRLLVGETATEAQVRRESPQARRIHLAVHALFDAARPLDSALVLRRGQTDASADDGLLQVWEIFEDLDLKADLVVLSACDTAAGKDFAGEGLLGFSRAFAFAGARATVASLWPVGDNSTAELMTRFYAARDRQPDDALALQQAMLEMLEPAALSANDQLTRGVGGLAPSAGEVLSRRAPQAWAAFQLYRH